MSVLLQAAETLKRMSDDLRGQHRNILAPVNDGMSLSEAAAKLRAALPTTYFTIEPEFSYHTDEVRVKWKVYISDRPTDASFFNGDTLTQAVNLALDSLLEKPEPLPAETTVEIANAALQEVLSPEPF